MSAPSHCQELRAELLGRGQLVGAGREHLAGCAECAAWAKRLGARESLIGSLPRLVAPRELASRVAAAIEAGERQERAIRALRGLGRLRTPAEMDDAVAAALPGLEKRRASRDPLSEIAGRRPAPNVLARLVSEELRDPAKARVARHVSSLPRFEAPVEFEARVRRDFSRSERRDESRTNRRDEARPVRANRPRTFLTVLAAIAAGLLAAVVVPQIGRGPKYPFRVVQVSSVDALDPAAREAARAISQGMIGPTTGEIR